MDGCPVGYRLGDQVFHRNFAERFCVGSRLRHLKKYANFFCKIFGLVAALCEVGLVASLCERRCAKALIGSGGHRHSAAIALRDQESAHLPFIPFFFCAFARGNLYTPAPFTTAASLPIHSSYLSVFSRKGAKAQSFSESRNPDSSGKTVYR